MNEVKDINGKTIKPYDVVKDSHSGEIAIVKVASNNNGHTGLIVINEITELKEWMETYPEEHWEVLGSLLTYWCPETESVKRVKVEQS